MTDYDRSSIPARYDSGRDHGPEVLDLWMNALASHIDARPVRILDLGCGTGRFTDALARHFGAQVIGLDPSIRMLAQAQKKEHAGHVHFVRARAEVLPLAAGSVDVVFMSMAFHHFSDRDRAAGECRRVLRRGGRVLVRTGTREQISAYPYYPFFPPSHAIMREVLPDCATFRNVFEGAGLILSAQEVITQTVAPDWDVYADKLATRADSVLVQLDASEFERGLAAVRQHAASSAGEAVIEPIDLFVFRA